MKKFEPPRTGHSHYEITAAAIEALPAWQKAVLKNQKEALAETYSLYPDYSFPWQPGGRKHEGDAYQYYEKERQYHYWMLETLPSGGNLEKRHEVSRLENNGFFTRGAEFFFRRIIAEIKRADIDRAARFAGSLLHANQDPAIPIHCFEGPDGLGWRAIESLFNNGNEFDPLHSAILSYADIRRLPVRIAIPGYQPRLLGMTPAEAAFHLYARHVQAVYFGRNRIIPMIQSEGGGKPAKASRLLYEMEQESARISADILFTALSMAFGRFEKSAVQKLGRVDLALYPPVDAPGLLSPPYRFAPIARGYALAPDGKKAPLRIRLGSRVQECKSGLATGYHALGYRIAYAVPRGVYAAFSCVAGLHADYAAENCPLCLKIKLRNRVCWQKDFPDKAAGGEKVGVDISKGGLLELAAGNPDGKFSGNGRNQIVWGEMILRK